MTPVLVTGGAGYLGSHVVDRLLDGGAPLVTVLDDFSAGREENLATRRGDPRLVVRRGTVLDPSLVEELVTVHPLVYHFAAAVGVRHIVNDPLTSALVNVRGTENVLASAFRNGSRVLLASTSEVYGRNMELPFREDSSRVLGPTWIQRWSYSTAKALDEHLAFAYADRGLRIAIVRYFNSYGPRIAEDGYGSVIARFAAQALAGLPLTVHGDGTQTRCFTFVSDTVEGTIRAATRDEALGRVFNIGATDEISIGELAARVRDGLSSSSEIRFVPYESAYPRGFEDTRRRVPDIGRARDVLGWEPRIGFKDGLRRTLEWCREHYLGARQTIA